MSWNALFMVQLQEGMQQMEMNNLMTKRILKTIEAVANAVLFLVLLRTRSPLLKIIRILF